MLTYIIKRLLWLIPIILAVTITVFTLMTFCPGDPAEIILSGAATPAEVEQLRESLGLNQPFFVRLGTFLYNTFIRFDFGKSWTTGQEIAASVKERLPRTVVLAIVSTLISIAIGIPLGIISGVNQGKFVDSVCMILALIGISIPGFWLALLLVILFAVKLDWLPAMGVGSLKHYILPSLAACTGAIASQARQTRSSMLEVIRSDYITTARAKGVSEFNVITKHALKNAMIPIITLLGTQFGRVLGGSMVVETVFAIPGMGDLVISGVNSRDYPVVQISSIIIAVFFSVSMLLVDVMYAVVDPRIKAQYQKKRKKVKHDA